MGTRCSCAPRGGLQPACPQERQPCCLSTRLDQPAHCRWGVQESPSPGKRLSSIACRLQGDG
eukprot:15472910-Alexandrium_andersonii.AAC.1